MRCHEVMRQTVSVCFEAEDVARCADQLREHDAPFLIILDERGDLAGAVSRLELEEAEELPSSRHTAVGDLARREPYLCGPDDDVAAVARGMSRSRSWLALVTEADCVVGAMTLEDVVEELERSPAVGTPWNARSRSRM